MSVYKRKYTCICIRDCTPSHAGERPPAGGVEGETVAPPPHHQLPSEQHPLLFGASGVRAPAAQSGRRVGTEWAQSGHRVGAEWAEWAQSGEWAQEWAQSGRRVGSAEWRTWARRRFLYLSLIALMSECAPVPWLWPPRASRSQLKEREAGGGGRPTPPSLAELPLSPPRPCKVHLRPAPPPQRARRRGDTRGGSPSCSAGPEVPSPFPLSPSAPPEGRAGLFPRSEWGGKSHTCHTTLPPLTRLLSLSSPPFLIFFSPLSHSPLLSSPFLISPLLPFPQPPLPSPSSSVSFISLFSPSSLSPLFLLSLLPSYYSIFSSSPFLLFYLLSSPFLQFYLLSSPSYYSISPIPPSAISTLFPFYVSPFPSVISFLPPSLFPFSHLFTQSLSFPFPFSHLSLGFFPSLSFSAQ
ncbi:hypothetical protein C7M84_022202 [Penaeus vannamei]|uniref:Uncharacterized protein n=1 Tax=Penaeus vannamei TaxID=6689 RepID=A0A423U7I7_PENVA|nr:hypothetical protein C7M84_022202 [Penaeus vannamei]